MPLRPACQWYLLPLLGVCQPDGSDRVPRPGSLRDRVCGSRAGPYEDRPKHDDRHRAGNPG